MLYNSLFRYGDQVLVNPHIWGQPASANPLLQLMRMAGTDWFDRYADSFDAVWNTARPWAPDRQEHHRRGRGACSHRDHRYAARSWPSSLPSA